MEQISASNIEQFQRDGAICLRQVISQNWLLLLAKGTEKALACPGPFHHIQSKNDDPGGFFTEYYLTRRIREFHRFVQEGPIAAIAGNLTNTDQIRFFFDGLFIKEPGTEKISQWHQDQPYYPINGTQVTVIWIPLDHVEHTECLTIVRGSHLTGKWYQPVLFRDDKNLRSREPQYEVIPDMDTMPKADLLSWDMSPGDCIAFHGLSLHGASGNPTKHRRRALSTTWLGTDTKFHTRPGILEPHFANLNYPEDSPLDDEKEFPLVWERQ